MSRLAHCPFCQHQFSWAEYRTKKWWKELFTPEYVWSIKQDIEQNTMVRCPNCGCEHSSDEVRLFGFLSPNGYRIAIGLAVVLAVVFAFVEK